jgi:hypothetical protein
VAIPERSCDRVLDPTKTQKEQIQIQIQEQEPEQGARVYDTEFLEFQDAYPSERRQGGPLAEQGFLYAVEKLGSYEALRARLEQHKRSEQWAVAKKIPNMQKWFAEHRWLQELAPPNGHGHALAEMVAKAAERIARDDARFGRKQ